MEWHHQQSGIKKKRFKTQTNFEIMKNIIFAVIGVIVIAVVYAFSNPKVDFTTDPKDGIQFHKEKWNDILALAKKENKLVFLDVYASWCGYCKRLKKNTFSDKEVGKFYNQNFIDVSLDAEQGEGIDIAHKYNISGFPALLYLNGDGEIVLQSGGYQKPGELIDLGKQTLKK